MSQPNSHGPHDRQPAAHEPEQADQPPRQADDQQADNQQQGNRLRPSLPQRPRVSDSEAAAFGRPNGVEGGFDTLHAPDGARENALGGDSAPLTSAPPPPESLAEAFSRPAGAEEVLLQRPADDSAQGSGEQAQQAPLWGSTDEPWRDPSAGAVLGGPAEQAEQVDNGEGARSTSAMLSLPEVLFGRRVKPRALGLLGVVVLLIGACGGLVGWGLANMGDSLTGELHVAQAQPDRQRPPGSVAKIAQRVAPAVVSVEVTAGDSGGLGSGVVIDQQGYVLTNYHVVALATRDKQAKITTVFTDGSRVQARIVGTDPKTDLAVLKVDVSDPVVVEIGSSKSLVAGDRVIALGSPFGLANTVTEGIVSAVHRPITAPGEHGAPPVTFDAIQTDAPINPGNSGGALVDSTGALVGINSLIRTVGNSKGEGGSIGLGFAIPADHAIEIARQIIETGEAKHPRIGVNAASVSSYSSAGARIKNVAPDGPAAKAGIREGDVVIKVGDRQVRNAAELIVAVRKHDIGAMVPVQLVRQGRQLTVDVKLAGD